MTEMWNEGGRVVFQCLVKERGEVVLTNGVAEVEGLAASATGAGSAAASSGSSPTLKSAPMFGTFLCGACASVACLHLVARPGAVARSLTMLWFCLAFATRRARAPAPACTCVCAQIKSRRVWRATAPSW